MEAFLWVMGMENMIKNRKIKEAGYDPKSYKKLADEKKENEKKWKQSEIMIPWEAEIVVDCNSSDEELEMVG